MRVEQPFLFKLLQMEFWLLPHPQHSYLCIVLSRKFVFIANGLITYGIASFCSRCSKLDLKCWNSSTVISESGAKCRRRDVCRQCPCRTKRSKHFFIWDLAGTRVFNFYRIQMPISKNNKILKSSLHTDLLSKNQSF